MLIQEQLQELPDAQTFLLYYQRHVLQVLREQLDTGLSVGFATADWTNNNAESKNYILKMISGI